MKSQSETNRKKIHEKKRVDLKPQITVIISKTDLLYNTLFQLLTMIHRMVTSCKPSGMCAWLLGTETRRLTNKILVDS